MKNRVFACSAAGLSGVFFLMLFLFCAVGASYGEVVAPRVDEPPVIDGKIDEPAWEEASWQTGFSDLLGNAAGIQTRFKVIHDNNYIYFAVEAMEPRVEDIRAEVTERDGRVFSDDCIEIFLDPNRHEIEYFHIIVNSIGTIYDSQVRQAGHLHDRSWNSEAKAAARVLEDRWQVEVAVPLVNLQLESISEEGWKFNVARERYAGESLELSTFASLQVFHRPDLFATMFLEDISIARYFWEISPLMDEHLFPLENDIVYRANFFITNKTGRIRLAGISAVLTSVETGDEKVYTGAELVNDNQSVKTGIEVPVPNTGDHILRLVLFDHRDSSARHAVRIFPLNLVYSPIEIDLKSPAYRSNIYSTQHIKFISGEAVFSLSEDALEGKVMECRLYREDTGEVVEKLETGGLSRRTSFSLPSDRLEAADYRLEIRLREEGAHEALYAASQRIRKLPPPDEGNEVWFDENGACYVNGEPFLPFGFFGPPGHPEFNVRHRYQHVELEMLDASWDEGQYFVTEPFLSREDYLVAGVSHHPDRLYTEEELNVVRETVEKFKGHPALLAWYLVDEPSIKRVLPERIVQLHDFLAEIDPYRPTIVLEHTVGGQYTYGHCADILMPDPYPGFERGGHSARGIDYVSSFIIAARESTNGRNPVWFTPQWFSWWDIRPEDRPNQREPNLKELRNMNYQAVVHGAKGVIGFVSRGWKHRADFREGLPFLAQEMEMLKGAVLAGDAKENAEILVEGPADKFFWTYREHNGHRYIFAVNTSTEKILLRGELKDGYSGALHVVSEGRAIRSNRGEFRDELDVYETRIYTTDAAAAEALSLEHAESEIARAREEIGPRPVGDNLARWERGGRASACSMMWGRRPYFAIDGICSIGAAVEKDLSLHQYYYWEASGSKPNWLLLEFPLEERVGRAVVYTPNISDFTLQVPDGNGWRNIASVSGNRDLRVEVVLESPVKTEALRLHITRTHPSDARSLVAEIEVYAE